MQELATRRHAATPRGASVHVKRGDAEVDVQASTPGGVLWILAGVAVLGLAADVIKHELDYRHRLRLAMLQDTLDADFDRLWHGFQVAHAEWFQPSDQTPGTIDVPSFSP